MARALFIVSVAIVLGVLIGRTAHGQDIVCGPRDDVLSALLNRYGEVPVARGLDVRGIVIEVTASRDGNWTLIFSGPTGVSCIMNSGDAFHLLPATRKGSF